MHSTFSLLRTASLVLVLLGCANAAFAQGDPGDGGPTPDPDPTAVPIDGGASLLLAAGVGLGVRHLRRRRPQA